MQIVKVAYINIDWIKNEKDASTDTAFMYHTNDDSTYAYYDFFKNHAKVGGEWLKEMGYDEVAEVIECHMDIEIGSIDALDEKAILYLADKLVIEDKEVSLEERFENTYKKFADQEIPSKAIEIRFNIAKRILDNICQREELFCENCASK